MQGVFSFAIHRVAGPNAESELASKVRNKRLLGYHDVRCGNEPDARLRKFIANDLPKVMPEARARFDKYKDLHEEYGKSLIICI